MKQKLISIIVPVYNVEKYLSDCLDSVLKQKFENLEIILIDDGSLDSSGRICDEYLQKDKRIRVVHKENGGVSSARNIGLDMANGEYIMFLDSDDMFCKHAFNTIITDLNENVDMYTYTFERINEEGLKIEIENKYKFKDGIYTQNDFLKKYYTIFHGFPWNIWQSVFKASIIKQNNIRFINGKKAAEDVEFYIEYVLHANNIMYKNFPILKYRTNRPGSAMTEYKPEILIDVLDTYSKYALGKNKFLAKCFSKIYVISLILIQKINDNEEREKIIDNVNFKIILKARGVKFFVFKCAFAILGRKITLELLARKLEGNHCVKKVGILTINDDNNYGNRLQNFALQKFLNGLGCRAETISNQKNIVGINYIKKKIKGFIRKFLISSKYRRYNSFMSFNKKINYSKYTIDANHIPFYLNDKYDFFIVGSDQVWNPSFGRMSDIDFLTFAKFEKRVTYSASFGIPNVPKNMEEYYKEKLNGLNKISVREENGKEIIEKLTGRKDVEVLIDPTMLLTADEWGKVLKKPKQLKTNKYILNYFLGDLSENRKKAIEKVAKENDCEIINLMDKEGTFYATGPSEFLYLEKNAFLICTDSFHSSVFALLYNKPFVIFKREGECVDMNSRIETLISKFKLKDREYNEECITYENLHPNYKDAYEILDVEREKSKIFLKKALKIKE